MTGAPVGAMVTGMSDSAVISVVPRDTFELPAVRARDLLLGSGPRMVRDASAPMLAFYLGWRSAGLYAGMALSTAASLAALVYERRQGRQGLMAQLMLGFVVFQAVVGVASGSERLYLAQPVLINAAWGFAFLGSILVRRPLTAAFAEEMYPFPDEVRSSDTFRRAFSQVSLAWAVYLLARSGLRLAMLATASVDAFVAVNLATGLPITTVLMGWSVWYVVRFFRRSEEWGEAIRLLDELSLEPAGRSA